MIFRNIQNMSQQRHEGKERLIGFLMSKKVKEKLLVHQSR